MGHQGRQSDPVKLLEKTERVGQSFCWKTFRQPSLHSTLTFCMGKGGALRQASGWKHAYRGSLRWGHHSTPFFDLGVLIRTLQPIILLFFGHFR